MARLLELRRGHWRIENSLRYIKDKTLGEDASQIHTGTGPAVMSLLRDAVVSLVHQAGFQQVAARLRYYSRHPDAALRLLGFPISPECISPAQARGLMGEGEVGRRDK